MSAPFNFSSFLTVVLLVICTCTFVKMQFPAVLERKTGFRGFFWKAARIGERLSPWLAAGCFTMGISMYCFCAPGSSCISSFICLSVLTRPLLFLFLT